MFLRQIRTSPFVKSGVLKIMHRSIRISEVPRQQLPPLPVPPLQQTIQRFLKSTAPLLSTEEQRTTERLAAEFAAPGGVGERLQQLLLNRAANSLNWLEAWWEEYAYLGNRIPLPIYSNTASLHPIRHFRSDDEHLTFAAGVLAGQLDFQSIVYSPEGLPVEKMGKAPLEMNQYYRMIGSCRIPGQPKDSHVVLDLKDPPKYIVVVHNGHFFHVPVMDAEGRALNQRQLRAQLEHVVRSSPSKNQDPVGILTSEHRDTWHRVYRALTQDATNLASVGLIQRALMVLCLDGAISREELSSAPNRDSAGASRTFHGGGTANFSTNRWFDKTMQMVVGRDGEFGLCFEHTAGDGNVIAALMQHADDYCMKNPPEKDPVPPAGDVALPKRIDFNITEEIRAAIETARRNMDKLVASSELHCLTFTSFGKGYVKSLKFSPDSFVQIALQLAFYRLHGEPTAQYEAAATRLFSGGRTETIRSCTPETLAFVRAMQDSRGSDSHRVQCFKQALTAHRDLALQAVRGQGVDRHLLGLRLIAAENGIEPPAIFQGVGYKRSTDMRLSTSQVPMRLPAFLYFGPTSHDGYGVCYNPQEERFLICITARTDCPKTSAIKFATTLETTLLDMQKLFTRVGAPKIASKV